MTYGWYGVIGGKMKKADRVTGRLQKFVTSIRCSSAPRSFHPDSDSATFDHIHIVTVLSA